MGMVVGRRFAPCTPAGLAARTPKHCLLPLAGLAVSSVSVCGDVQFMPYATDAIESAIVESVWLFI